MLGKKDILTAMAFATALIFAAPVLAADAIDSETWKIVGGKLYLNYSKGIQKIWEGNQTDYIAAADKNWPNVLN